MEDRKKELLKKIATEFPTLPCQINKYLIPKQSGTLVRVFFPAFCNANSYPQAVTCFMMWFMP